MKDLTVFISSSDAYKDCWDGFFKLLKKYWPNCDLPLILNTENESYKYDGLNIECTLVGKNPSFGETFIKGLAKVKTKHVMVIMIDYFIMAPVDDALFSSLYEDFNTLKMDCLYLVNQEPTVHGIPTQTPGIYEIDKFSSDKFSFQVAFWDKQVLLKYVLPHEDPWTAEKYGTQRAHVYNDKIGFVHKDYEPFKYLLTGVLHKGGWIKQIVPFFESEGIAVNYGIRGMYTPKKQTFVQKLKSKKKRFWVELKSQQHLNSIKK